MRIFLSNHMDSCHLYFYPFSRCKVKSITNDWKVAVNFEYFHFSWFGTRATKEGILILKQKLPVRLFYILVLEVGKYIHISILELYKKSILRVHFFELHVDECKLVNRTGRGRGVKLVIIMHIHNTMHNRMHAHCPSPRFALVTQTGH